MDAKRPATHFRLTGLRWFEFDPQPFVERALTHAVDDPGLDARLAVCRRAAWQCDCYLVLAKAGTGGVAETAVLWDGGEHLAVDLDQDGNPVGIEFLDRLPCKSG